ncbi:MAG: hypothetical protein CBD16_08650 [Betaproteobacteria bacterium TMED156]|nr:MAG: hypothetical protein CBD16_08650 [Betaproteobacteria bacterium TMED156]|tara:strand:+ start:154 stop:606 length:453 start_codon:yes stop_codon:yes gene_type:complete
MSQKKPQNDFDFLFPPWTNFINNFVNENKADSQSFEDFDQKIEELRSVEKWLKMNLSILQTTINGLEINKKAMETFNNKSSEKSGVDETMSDLDKSTNNISKAFDDATSKWWENVENQMQSFVNVASQDNASSKVQNKKKTNRKKRGAQT